MVISNSENHNSIDSVECKQEPFVFEVYGGECKNSEGSINSGEIKSNGRNPIPKYKYKKKIAPIDLVRSSVRIKQENSNESAIVLSQPYMLKRLINEQHGLNKNFIKGLDLNESNHSSDAVVATLYRNKIKQPKSDWCCYKVKKWLHDINLGQLSKLFHNYNGADLLRLSVQDIYAICGQLQGSLLVNCLKNVPVCSANWSNSENYSDECSKENLTEDIKQVRIIDEIAGSTCSSGSPSVLIKSLNSLKIYVKLDSCYYYNLITLNNLFHINELIIKLKNLVYSNCVKHNRLKFENQYNINSNVLLKPCDQLELNEVKAINNVYLWVNNQFISDEHSFEDSYFDSNKEYVSVFHNYVFDEDKFILKIIVNNNNNSNNEKCILLLKQ